MAVVIIGLAAALLAGITTARAQAPFPSGANNTVVALPPPAAIATNLLAGTVVAGGAWQPVPQNVDGWLLLTTWTAGGTLAGQSNTTVYVDLSPDQIAIVSNSLSITGTQVLSGTNTTPSWLSKTNTTGYAYWRVGKATTATLTNQYFKLQFCTMRVPGF